MSLYEQFHSDINKKFMFDMIKNIIQKEINTDISLDPDNYNQFISTFETIFNENNADEIEEMNKFLLDHNIEYFFEKFKKPDPQMQNDFERMLKEREIETQQPQSPQPQSPQPQSPQPQSPQPSEDIPIDIQTIIEEDEDHMKVKKLKKVKKKEEEEKPININSNQRTNINSSRYNYKINLMKESISSKDLKSISRLIIPIEDNYLFTIPVLKIIIPELNCDIHMQQEEIIQGNHRNYGVYKCIENHKLSKEFIERITIQIQDVSGKKYHGSDILKVNIMEVKKNRIYFTCSSMNHLDYQISDYIKIINNNTSTLFQVLQDPLKIKKIQNNIIICEYTGLDHLDNRIYTDIDMKVMNMSNQNIFYFN